MHLRVLRGTFHRGAMSQGQYTAPASYAVTEIPLNHSMMSVSRKLSGSSGAGLGEYDTCALLQMPTAFDDVTSPARLMKAWRRLWSGARPKSRSSYGVDEISLNDFERDATSNIKNLSRVLRQRTFSFSLLRPHLIEKSNGKLRVICIPTTQDQVVQGAILDFLTEKYNDRYSNKISYGFLRGRTVRKALEAAVRLRGTTPWVFKTDITAFFDRIPRDLLKERMRRVVRESSLHDLLGKAIDCEIAVTTRVIERKIKKLGIKERKGVRQGMPLSPFFSNLILERFDKDVEKRGFAAIRYADDLIFFANGRGQCAQIDSFCRASLAKEELEIPAIEIANSKSVIYDEEAPAEFLGAAIFKSEEGYLIKLLPEQMAKVEKALLDLGNISELLARRITLAKLGRSLSSRKAGYIHAYEMCSNIDQLEQKLDSIEQKILKKLYVGGLGIDLSKLSPEAYRFLGLAR